MAISRREALLRGAVVVPAGGLFLAGARGQQPGTATPVGERPGAPGADGMAMNLGEDPLLAACLLIQGRTQIEKSKFGRDRSKVEEVKSFAQAEIDEHETIKAKLARLGYEYPATPRFPGMPANGVAPTGPAGTVPSAAQPVPTTPAGQAAAAAGQPAAAPPGTTTTPLPAETGVPMGMPLIAVGKLLMPPGAGELLQTSHEVGERCVSNFEDAAKAKLAEKGQLKFEKMYIGDQLHAHHGLLDHAQVFLRKSTPAMKPIVKEGLAIIEQHIATLERIMEKLEKMNPADLG